MPPGGAQDMIKSALDAAGLDYTLEDADGSEICVTDGYEAAARETGAGEYVLLLPSGNIVLKIPRSFDAAEAAAKLIGAMLIVNRQPASFDSVFSKLLQQGGFLDEQTLRELKIRPPSGWVMVYISSGKEPGEDIRDIFLKSLPRRVSAALFKENKNTIYMLAEVPKSAVFMDMTEYVAGLYGMLEEEFSEKINMGLKFCKPDEDIAMAASIAKKTASLGRIIKGADGLHIYDQLGLARMIANLDTEATARLRKELAEDSGVELFDTELAKTVRALFQNNLNVSETARSLFIHRNTLIYRIEKINKLTGLDLNRFEDAAYLRMLLLLKADTGGKEGG